VTRTALITGAAGFIGFHTARRLLDDGWRVVGLDAMTPYYDPRLKRARLAQLTDREGFSFTEGRLEEPGLVARLMAGCDTVIHLAAQAGVRYSIDAPESYVESNLVGTFRVLEAARSLQPAHLMLASTSSAYGANTAMPYAEGDRTAHPLSFYAATKIANEAMAHSYAHLYRVPTTMFRFFTVYGPWGRPDMALFKFVKAIAEGRPIDLYNHGDMSRDFTYAADLVEGIRRLIDVVPGTVAVDGDSLSPVAPFRIVNIGNGKPVPLADFVAAIEAAMGRPATRNLLPMQPGDVPATWADAGLIARLTGSPLPQTPLSQGVRAFVDWYRGWNQPI
jgi:UDP-glucuronate 4-epimerase